MTIRKITFVLLIFSTLIFAGCGGGAGSAAPLAAQPTTAVLKYATQGTIPSNAQSIVGIQMSVNLPTGVTISSSNPASAITPSGVLGPGTAQISGIDYNPSTGKLTFIVWSTTQAGFSTGEFVTINCQIAAGASPAATDFSPYNTTITYYDGSSNTGLAITYTADIR